LNLYAAEGDGWKPWYRDYWLGTVIASDDTYRGYGSRAFRLPAPRTEAVIHSSSFLTTARLATNALDDGGFESTAINAFPANYRFEKSGADGTTSASVVAGGRSGAKCLLIENLGASDSRIVRTLTVTPNTRYVLAGWVKTQSVTGAEVGGTLSFFDPNAHSEPILLGEHGWTYVAQSVMSQADGTITIAPRLGYFGSEVTGRAYFDDLVLVKY
jgi:hypothetical protein